MNDKCSGSNVFKKYMSKENINYIQHNIIVGVFINSNKKYRLTTKQKYEDIYVKMEEIYYMNAYRIDNDCAMTLQYLNKTAIIQIVNEIIKTLEFNDNYLTFLNSKRVLMDRPKMT